MKEFTPLEIDGNTLVSRIKNRKRFLSLTGFTLIELLIALALVATILTLIYGSYASSIAIMNDSRQRVELYQEARLILEVISGEISSAFISPGNERLKLEGEEDELHFSTASGGLAFDAGSTDIREVSYYLEPATGLNGNSLWRREQWPVDDDIREGGEALILIENLESVVFSYYGEEGWQEEWSWEEEGRLPRAVRIVMVFQDEADIKTSFSTLANLVIGDW
jgi:prepilin-type N-terminal cleavage/methylation domain-containing protein